MSSHFSGQTSQIYVFFLTMQRSNKNIISPKVNKFLDIYGYWRINPYILEKIIPQRLDNRYTNVVSSPTLKQDKMQFKQEFYIHSHSCSFFLIFSLL